MRPLHFALAFLSSACIAAPIPDASPIAAADSEVTAPDFRLEIRDRRGRLHAEAAPTWPLIRIETDSPIDDPYAVVLTHGLGWETLEDDLESAPLRAATREATLITRRTLDDRGVLLEPTGHLARGERFLVGVATWASGADDATPFVAAIDIDTNPEAGAWVVETWPADATYGVPTDLPFVAARFDGALDLESDSLTLVSLAGPVAGTTHEVPCREIGWTEGTCALFELEGRLSHGARHVIGSAPGLVDLTGAPTGPLRSELFTAASAPPPATFVEAGCSADQSLAGPACVFVDDRRLVIGVAASAPARFFATAAGRTEGAVAPRGSASLTFDGLAAETDVTVGLTLVGLSGHEERRVFRVRTSPPLPEIGITEVRSDPSGPEPAQEFVELLNSGAMPIDLAGFSLADREDRAGDVVERAAVVPAGGRVLLVSDGFDPSHPSDVAVPGGVPLVRLGASLASGGLSNAGEPLYLRDAAGRRVSAAPALATGAGRCAHRISPDPRPGDLSAFEIGECTPGRPP